MPVNTRYGQTWPPGKRENSDLERFTEQSRLAAFLREHGRPILLILLLSLPLFFFWLGGWGFFDPDEGRYAEIPREMLESGDFITPRLNYVNYFEKPPLMYWAVAGAFRVFGYNEWAARLVPALAALAGVFMTYALGRRMFGARTGLLGAVVLMTMAMWPVLARLLVIDMLFSVLLFSTLAFWWMGQSENERRPGLCFMAFWAALALAMMAKGPVAVLLAGGIIFVQTALTGRWQVLRQMRWGQGVALFLLLTAPWFALVAERNPGFNHFFWYGQNIGRFLGEGENREHEEAFSYFFKLMPLVLLPWSFFVPGAILAARKYLWPLRSERQRAACFLVCIAVGVTLFFSASTCKLLTYILPVLPPVAILLAFYFERLSLRPASAWRASLAFGVSLLSLVLVAGAITMFVIRPDKLSSKISVEPLLLRASGAFLLLWAAVLATAIARRKLRWLTIAVAGGSTILLTGPMPVIAALAPGQTSRGLVQTIQPGLDAGAQLITYDGYGQSFSFYTARRLKIIGGIGELDGGYRDLPAIERDKWFSAGIGELRRHMERDTPVYCVIAGREAATQAIRSLPDTALIAGNRKFCIIGNQAAQGLTPPVTAAATKSRPR